MPVAANLDWLYHLLGYTLAAAGLLLLLWSLFWDRSRGRRRCPKCWYDMSGAPGLKCPECGREAKQERSMFRTRIRRRPAAFAILTMLASAGLFASLVSRAGWLRQVPGSVLVRIVSEKDLQSGSNGAALSWPTTPPRGLMDELVRRASLNGLTAADWRVLIERAHIVNPSRVPWPLDQPLHVDIQMPPWLASYCRMTVSIEDAEGMAARTGTAWFAVPPANRLFEPAAANRGKTSTVDINVVFLSRPPISSVSVNPSSAARKSRVLVVHGVRMEYSTVGRTQDILRPAEHFDPSGSGAILEEGLRFHGYWATGPQGRIRQISARFDQNYLFDSDVAVAPRIQVLHGSEVVAETVLFLKSAPSPKQSIASADLVGDVMDIQDFDESDPSWVVRISGDPLNSLRCRDCTQYWSGSFELPLVRIRRDPFPAQLPFNSNFRPRRSRE